VEEDQQRYQMMRKRMKTANEL